ncbi:hypothetical protein ACEWY4_022658 [Coilia grayii]|uniref:Ubiquitin-like protease family profile domain-containing protein n=1 Tax=Coilia grayii TaxID=363190 RepID=A0ABD1J3D7_9TELE
MSSTSRQTEGPYRIPHTSAENGCTKVHWTQFACGSSSKSSAQPNGTSSTNHTQCPQSGGRIRRELRLVLTDVLKTDIGRRYVEKSGRGHLKTSQSEGRRRESQVPRRQPKQADHRRQSNGSELTPDPSSKLRIQSVRSVRDGEQPRPIHPSPSKPIDTPLKAKSAPCEASRVVESSKTKTPISANKSADRAKAKASPSHTPKRAHQLHPKLVRLDTPRHADPTKPKPALAETPKPLASFRASSVNSETQKSLSSSRVRPTDPDRPSPAALLPKSAKRPCPRWSGAGSRHRSGLPLSWARSPAAPPPALGEGDPPTAPDEAPAHGCELGDGVQKVIVGEGDSSEASGSSPQRHTRLHQAALTHTPAQPRTQETAAEGTQQEDVRRKRRLSVNGGEGWNGVKREEGEGWNGMMREDECVMRKSVLRLSLESGHVGAAEEPPIKRPHVASPAEKQPTTAERRCLIRTSSQASQSEPIVLSSEEECDEEGERAGLNGADAAVDDDDDGDGDAAADDDGDEGGEDEGAAEDEDGEGGGDVPHEGGDLLPVPPSRHHKSPHTVSLHIMDMLPQDADLNGVGLTHLPSIELPFSSLHVGGVTALANGKVEISDESITFPLMDSLGVELMVVVATSHLRTYSLLDGAELQELRGGGLAEQEDAPPPSHLLLWVSDVQAQQLHDDLSVIQPGTRPAEGSVCVCVTLQECVLKVEQALLASVMDIVGLRHRNSQLLSPLTATQALQAIHTARDTHTLSLLRLHHTHTQPSTSAQEEPEPVYSIEHRCDQGRYSVREAKPGPEWLPYKHQGPARRLIQFPPPPCKGSITVTTEDLECLDSGKFLNDVIIDFYLKYLIVERTPKELAEKCHVFSSFFYKQLTRRDNANEDCSSATAEHRRHQRVKTWTRNVDIFSKDFLFVPVNQESHWYLVVICFPGLEEAQFVAFDGPAVVRGPGEDDSGESQAEEPTALEASTGTPASDEADKETNATVPSSVPPPDCTEQTCTKPTVCKRPCILIMDSLKLSIHKRVVKLLREYLQVEWEVRRGVCRDFSAELMEGSSCPVPQQDNSSDCGLYLLHYAETFLKDPVVNFDLPLCLERWFSRQQVRRKRDEIRNLVLRLCRFQPSIMGNAVLPQGAGSQPSMLGNGVPQGAGSQPGIMGNAVPQGGGSQPSIMGSAVQQGAGSQPNIMGNGVRQGAGDSHSTC